MKPDAGRAPPITLNCALHGTPRSARSTTGATGTPSSFPTRTRSSSRCGASSRAGGYPDAALASPQVPKCRHGGSTRRARPHGCRLPRPDEMTSVLHNPDSTSSPGAVVGTKITRPSGSRPGRPLEDQPLDRDRHAVSGRRRAAAVGPGAAAIISTPILWRYDGTSSENTICRTARLSHDTESHARHSLGAGILRTEWIYQGRQAGQSILLRTDGNVEERSALTERNSSRMRCRTSAARRASAADSPHRRRSRRSFWNSSCRWRMDCLCSEAASASDPGVPHR